MIIAFLRDDACCSWWFLNLRVTIIVFRRGGIWWTWRFLIFVVSPKEKYLISEKPQSSGTQTEFIHGASEEKQIPDKKHNLFGDTKQSLFTEP